MTQRVISGGFPQLLPRGPVARRLVDGTGQRYRLAMAWYAVHVKPRPPLANQGEKGSHGAAAGDEGSPAGVLGGDDVVH